MVTTVLDDSMGPHLSVWALTDQCILMSYLYAFCLSHYSSAEKRHYNQGYKRKLLIGVLLTVPEGLFYLIIVESMGTFRQAWVLG